MNTIIVLFCAFGSGLVFGRLADLMFKDLRLGFPWLFGPIDDCFDDEVRLLTFCCAATMAAAVFALIDGVSPVATIIFTPFIFNWAAGLLLLAHRAIGPAFEIMIVRFHPVDFGYDMFKNVMSMAWSRGSSSLTGKPVPPTSWDHDGTAEETHVGPDANGAHVYQDAATDGFAVTPPPLHKVS